MATNGCPFYLYFILPNSFFLNRLVGGHFCLQAPRDSVGFISCRFFKNMLNNIEKGSPSPGRADRVRTQPAGKPGVKNSPFSREGS